MKTSIKVKLVSVEEGITLLGFRKIAAIARKLYPASEIYFIATGNFYSIKNFLFPSKKEYFSDKDMRMVAKEVGDADLICFSSMTSSAPYVEKIAKFIKKKNPKAFILWGGAHCVIYPQEAIKHVDAICIGEGEKSFEIFLDAFLQKRNFKNIPGTWFRSNKGVRKNVNMPLCTSEELSNLPHRYIGLDCQIYDIGKKIFRQFTHKDYIKYNGLTFRTIWTIGCPFSCTYCANDIFTRIDPKYRLIRYPSVDYVISEIEEGLRSYPFVSTVLFFDDNFISVPTEIIKDLIKEYKKRINLPFYIPGIHPNLVTKEKVELIGRAGANRMRMGIQSGSERILSFYKRSTPLKNIKRSADLLIHIGKKYKMIPPSYDIISDNPLEKKEDIIQTLKLLYGLKRPYTLTVFSLRVFPNTQLADYFKEHPDTDISYQTSSYLETRKTLTNITYYLLATFKPPKFVFNWILDNIKDYDEDQEAYKTIYYLVKIIYLFSRAMSHFVKLDFSTLAGIWVYYLWRSGLINVNHRDRKKLS